MIATVSDADVLAAGGTIVTATHRLARQIRQRHDRARAATGARAWPAADVLPLDAWLRRTWDSIALGDLPLGRRLLSDEESRLVWRGVLATDGQDRLDAGVVVPLVAGGWRLCQSWGVSASSLRDAADSDDAKLFAGWVRAYASELRRQSWMDAAGLLGALGREGQGFGRDGRVAGGAPLGFAGFEPWTPALDSLAGNLRAVGIPVGLIDTRRRQGTPCVVVARDDTDELARAFTWAASHAGRDAAIPPAIVIPDLEQHAARVRRVGLDILAPGWRLQEPAVRPLALAVGRQLADYPIVFCALNLLELVAGDITFDQASQLIRSPYVAGAGAERGGRAQAEIELRRIPLDRLGLPDLMPMLGRRAPDAARRWQQAAALAAPVRARRLPPGQWAGLFASWLGAAGWPGDRGLNSEEFQAMEAWQRLLESFAGMDEVAGAVSLRAALGLLGQQARDRAFEPESAGDAIQVLTLREAEGQDFGALWICGMTADQWPPPARPHPLIPLALQQAAGIPEATPGILEAQTRRRFERLLAAADQVMVSWPAEQDEAEMLPSPLLANLRRSDDPYADVLPHPDLQRVAGSGLVEEVAVDPPPPLPDGADVRGGARLLAMQAVCPARAFVEFRLRGAPLEPPARPLDPAMRGKVVHALLERLYKLEPCRRGLGELDADDLRPLFVTVLTDVLDEFLEPGQPYFDGLRLLEAERLWKLLLTLRDLDADRAGFSVETELAREARVGSLSLAVRLDRLDRLDAGGEVVIDYKTGRFDASGWKKPRLPESQLPLYAVAGGCAGVGVVQLRPPAARLRGVGDDTLGIPGIKAPAAFFRQQGLDWETTIALWRTRLETLAREFASGDFRVDPTDRRWAADQFAGLTRIHEFLPAGGDDELSEGEEE